jgi:NAD(P)-dependent dehydrogenase (short-subunit alcohol dehydrogenase family)
VSDSALVTLSDRVAIVTGGGRGLGRCHSLELARRGAKVVVNDVAPEHANSVVAEIQESGGESVTSYASVTTRDGAQEIVDSALDHFGTVDVVVNNAGSMRNAMFEEQTPETLDAMLDVHIRGGFFVTQAAWPVLREKRYGRVVMTCSAGGLFAMQGESNYAAAKAGLYGLGKALAYEGRELGILVNILLPHGNSTIGDDQPVPGMIESFPPGLMEAVAPKRLPEAVAPFVAYLASSACTVSGEAFEVGCGHVARVFVGVGRGWTAADPTGLTAEDIVEHLDEIRAVEPFSVPDNLYEEIALIGRSIGWQPLKESSK